MINVTGDPATDLYTKNIIAEHFPEYCFSEARNINCKISIKETAIGVKVNAVIEGSNILTEEEYINHSNKRLAKTAAIGKAVICFAMAKGLSPAPYGVLTGVRPFKIAIDLLSRLSDTEALSVLKNTYLVSKDKADMLINVAKYDNKLRRNHKDNDVSVYISVPFCPSRCNYCSFISSAAPSKLELIDKYIDDLIFEIDEVSKLISSKNLKLNSIYIGGGTPTVLTAVQLDRLLKKIHLSFDTESIAELTLEAGRPDTITAEKLEVMKKLAVTRTCVNCQTTNDRVLETIGRHHTADDFFKAFELVRSFGFNSINTDIIAGLNTDTPESFKKTVNDVIALSPESITVHTLCVKKSAAIRSADFVKFDLDIDELISYSKSACISSGYLPYYLYKQKYTVGNHENVGYCKPSNESYYNIAMMNEIEHIIGIGAGATSRLIGCNENNKIEHFANYKYPTEYIGNRHKINENLSNMERVLSDR